MYINEKWANTPYFHAEVINTNYNAIETAFGKPTDIDIDGKTQCEWELTTPNGNTFYIYDWKEYGTDVRKAPTIEWHIGRSDRTNILDISRFLEEKGFTIDKWHLADKI